MRKSLVLAVFLAAALLFSCSVASAVDENGIFTITLSRTGTCPVGPGGIDGEWEVKAVTGGVVQRGVTYLLAYDDDPTKQSDPLTFDIRILPATGTEWNFIINNEVKVDGYTEVLVWTKITPAHPVHGTGGELDLKSVYGLIKGTGEEYEKTSSSDPNEGKTIKYDVGSDEITYISRGGWEDDIPDSSSGGCSTVGFGVLAFALMVPVVMTARRKK